ncbi:hypothetical protein SKAU_G00209350 [Synaphobranchus kaupii]|uniref:PiggyBac transposable element-derived protein domain-containing protein n=1 Tax=Synaphobranchus kaupii TaxID=118154 RepID=A0A9Q1F912_SYNKA|nr:hypothetical protein SKAU_G00209350 [Synaphobranchus kaupii]
MKRGEVTFRENGTQLAVKWQDKRDVNFLTTVHPSAMAQSGRLDRFTGEPKVKPACILDYNKKMGAVDKADMITSLVDCARKVVQEALLSPARHCSPQRLHCPSQTFCGMHAKQGLSAVAGERADPGASLTPALNWRATLCQHPTAAHREALSFFCASDRSPGTEHKAALQGLPLHHPTQKGQKIDPLHVRPM